jgi:hypothetical protein
MTDETWTDINTLINARTEDPSVSVGEDIGVLDCAATLIGYILIQ